MAVPARSGITILCMVAAVVLCAQSADRLIAQGDTLLSYGRSRKALEKFDAAVKAAPSAESYSARASAWYYMGRDKEFLADVQEALRLDSLHPEANYQRALIAHQDMEETTVVHYADRALGRAGDPDLRQKVLIVRGEAFAKLGRTAQAISDLTKGTAGRMDDLDALSTLAHLYDVNGDHEASLGVLEKLCKAAPYDIGNWSNRGFELNTLGRYDEALPVLEQALSLDKDEPIVLSNKAYALMKLGHDADAMDAVDRSLKVYAENAYALQTRGMLYLRKGDREHACNDLTMAKSLGAGPEVDPLINQYCGGTGGH
jgi:tetratricopeptide (TPR) repeat protein